MGDRNWLIGLEITARAYKFLNFLKLRSDQLISFEELERRFGPATASALWELRELGLVQLLWESLDGHAPKIAGAALAELGRSASLPTGASSPGILT
jgi:hypothetical protein